jgi:hypothetical protein
MSKVVRKNRNPDGPSRSTTIASGLTMPILILGTGAHHGFIYKADSMPAHVVFFVLLIISTALPKK